jgi:hypothetical protein
MRKVVRLLIWWVGASSVAAAALLLYAIPWHPHSPRGWTVFLLAALPVTCIGDYIGRKIFYGALMRRLDALGSGIRASVERVAYVLLCFIGVAVLAICALAMLSNTGWLGAL